MSQPSGRELLQLLNVDSLRKYARETLVKASEAHEWNPLVSIDPVDLLILLDAIDALVEEARPRRVSLTNQALPNLSGFPVGPDHTVGSILSEPATGTADE